MQTMDISHCLFMMSHFGRNMYPAQFDFFQSCLLWHRNAHTPKTMRFVPPWSYVNVYILWRDRGVGPKSLVLFNRDTGPRVNYHTPKYIYEPWCSGERLPKHKGGTNNERRLKPAGGSFGGDVPPPRLRLTSNYKQAVRKPQITSRGFIGSKAQLNGLFQVQ